MNTRTKLLLSFFSLSTLIIVVGLLFYVQLKSLIEPLTPQSIPLSITNLENNIDRDHFINELLYQQLLVQHDLESYVYTNQLSALQEYYMNDEILAQLWNRIQEYNQLPWSKLKKQFAIIGEEHSKILYFMQTNNMTEAKQLLMNTPYNLSTHNVDKILNHYFQTVYVSSNEIAEATLKIAAANTRKILQHSLNITLLIFLDAILISILLAIISARAITKPINRLREDIEHMSKESIHTPVSTTLLNLKGEIGDLARAFVSLIDKLRNSTVLRDELLVEIERRKQSEEDLRKTAQRLRESNYDLEQFAFAASHDLRAPLRAINNLVDWIENDSAQQLPKNSLEHLGLLKQQVRRLDGLIAGILEYSRVDKISAQLETIDIQELLRDIIQNLNPPTHIHIEIKPDIPTIKTKRIMLTQIFMNLISNAIKYNNKTEGRIVIGCRILEGYLQFFVSDNGPGIDAHHYDTVFEIFQTLHSREDVQSTGIGLAIVKKIIEKENCKIWINSIVGNGATFYFTWPKP